MGPVGQVYQHIYIYIEIRYLYAYKNKTCEGTNHMEIFAT